MTINRLIAARAANDDVAIRFAGRSITYADFALRAAELADRFSELGIGRGTRLGLLMGNRPEWLLTAVAAARTGALLVPLSTFLRPAELEAMLRHADVEAVVHAPRFAGVDYSSLFGDLASGGSRLSLVLSWPETDRLPSVARGPLAEPRTAEAARPHDEAIVFFTSGSTGEPKGVVHAHGALASQATRIAERMGVGAADRSWSTFPFFFSAGLVTFAYAGFAAGATLVLQEKFEPGEALRLLDEERSTVYLALPHQVEAMMAEPAFARADLSLLRKANRARSLPHDAFLRHDHDAIDGWGMTETLTFACSTVWSDPLEVRLASHGKPLPGVEIRVVDPENGEPLAPGSEGELRVRGPNLFRAHLGEKPGAALDRDGFFPTGDLGRVDAEGNVTYLGRLKDVIKTAGVNVSAAEIEALLATHPAVEAAYVVGIPDASRGELIAAFVVASRAVEAEDLQRFIGERTARFKAPRWIFFTAREDLPQTGSGKIMKRRLREIALERIGGG